MSNSYNHMIDYTKKSVDYYLVYLNRDIRPVARCSTSAEVTHIVASLTPFNRVWVVACSLLGSAEADREDKTR